MFVCAPIEANQIQNLQQQHAVVNLIDVTTTRISSSSSSSAISINSSNSSGISSRRSSRRSNQVESVAVPNLFDRKEIDLL